MSEPTEISSKQLKQNLPGGAEPTTITVEQLRQHLSEFQRYLDIDAIVPTLVKAGLLNDSEAWDLTNCEHSPRDRITQLLTFIISRKGSEGPDRLIECIRLSGDCHLQHGRLVRLFSRSEQEVNSITLETEKLRWKMEAFANLVMDVYNKMQVKIANGNPELGSVKVFVATSPVSAKYPEYSLSPKDKEAIMQADNLASVFIVLSRYWNYQNLYLLEQLMREFIGDDILLLQYQKKMETIDSTEELILQLTTKPNVELDLCERFSKLLRIVLETFKQLQVNLEVLQIFMSVIGGASSLKDLARTHTLEEVFCMLLNHCISWENYGILMHLVEQFGDEHSKLLVRDYDRDYQDFRLQRPSSGNTGSWIFINAVPFIPDYEREAFGKQVSMLRGQFANIVVQSLQLPSSAKQFIDNLSASTRYPSLIRPFSGIANNASTLSDIFLHLNHFGWNYRQYHLLHCLIKRFGTPHLRSSLCAYTDQLCKFEKTTTLAKFLWEQQGTPPSRHGFVRMALTLNVDLKKYTLQEVMKFQTSFARTFCVNPCCLLMYSGKMVDSAFKLKFLVPSGVDCILVLESGKKAEFFHIQKVSKVKLYEQGCYDFSFDLREHGPPEKMRTKADGIRKLAEKLQNFETQIEALSTSRMCTLL